MIASVCVVHRCTVHVAERGPCHGWERDEGDMLIFLSDLVKYCMEQIPCFFEGAATFSPKQSIVSSARGLFNEMCFFLISVFNVFDRVGLLCCAAQ